MRTIRTVRLRMTPVTAANAGVLWEVLQEPDLRDYQDLPDVDREQFQRVVGARPKRFGAGAVGRFEWLLYYADGDDDVLGWVSLRIGDTNRSSAEIGYSVVRAHRGPRHRDGSRRGARRRRIHACTLARDTRLLFTRERVIARRPASQRVWRVRNPHARRDRAGQTGRRDRSLARSRALARRRHFEPGGHSIVMPARWKPAYRRGSSPRR